MWLWHIIILQIIKPNIYENGNRMAGSSNRKCKQIERQVIGFFIGFAGADFRCRKPLHAAQFSRLASSN